MATYPIRQLADNGGTAQFVPVTAPEAVQFPDGSNLNTFIGSVATIESNPVAANHAVGEFLCINGQVYKVIDAITAGDSISLGENVQVTNLGSQITALNNRLTGFIKTAKTGGSKAIASGTTTSFDIDVTLSGYTPVTIAGFDVKDGNINLINIGFASATTIRIWVKNISNASITVEPSVTVLYFPALN